MKDDDSIAHIVRAGEHLAGIARRYGCAASEIWDDPANAELKNSRKSWNVLAPGDVVYIKKKDAKWLAVSAGATETFTAHVERINVMLTLQDDTGPIKNERFVAHTAAGDIEGTTGGDGSLEFGASVLDQIISLELTDRNHQVTLHVGGLDPVDTITGLQARLFHLGFLKHHSSVAVLDAQTRAAVRDFQNAKHLRVTGEPNDDTNDALRRAFGC